MRKNMIMINDNGTVTVPNTVQMRDFEIAQLFGVFTPTIKANIKAILKSEVVTVDLTGGVTLAGNHLLPDYYGLDMITALVFRIQSPQAELFRQWVIRKMVVPTKIISSQLFISVNENASNRLMN